MAGHDFVSAVEYGVLQLGNHDLTFKPQQIAAVRQERTCSSGFPLDLESQCAMSYYHL